MPAGIYGKIARPAKMNQHCIFVHGPNNKQAWLRFSVSL
jgi:hypothetical protein